MEQIEKTEEITKNKDNKKKRRRIEKIMFSIGITSVVFIVASYAWFIGTTEVAVSDFEIGVKSSEGLTISLDGINFSNTITISESAVTTELDEIYAGHKNHWVGQEGLVPISTVGTFNANASTLDLFSKTSITSLNGGYKLRTDLIENITSMVPDGEDEPVYAINEQDGYAVFDIFIRNQSGSGYIEEFDQYGDEGIYLIDESSVTLTSSGVDEEGQPLTGGDGIENSIRLAFMQVGRVSSMNAGAAAQSISCKDDEEKHITGLCNKGISNVEGNETGLGITWNIWEPNDVAHNSDSVQHFTKICKKRTAATTYEGACDALVDGEYFDTYAANEPIGSDDNVNIYDGVNGYSDISTKLTKFDYFRDTEKMYSGSERSEIFFLAPNSITKIRVYVYLEGQDVDNYDLGIIGKKISITFGFTKDKFDTMEDITTPGENLEEPEEPVVEPEDETGESTE